MRLTDLNPRWFSVDGASDARDGVAFDCPCERCASGHQIRNAGVARRCRLGVQFAGRPMTLQEKLDHVHEFGTFDVPPGVVWEAKGDSFDTLTLSPSVDASASGHWHGHVKNGEAKKA